jgi:hypothetical protein
MNFASAYPDSAISAPMMIVIALVMTASLAAWLILVFLADRQGSGKETGQAGARTPVLAALDRTAEDEHNEATRAPADSAHGAAA